MTKSYKEIMPQINTFVFDVDGVLTNGLVTVTSNGELLRTMHTKDGYALKTAVDSGYAVCIISGGKNKGVQKRLEGLGIDDVFLGAHNKVEIFNRYLSKKGIERSRVLYMGDDIPDFPVMKIVGLPCCPKDAVPEIQEIAAYISQKKGGNGCVRDVIEQVMKVQGRWNGRFDAKYD